MELKKNIRSLVDFGVIWEEERTKFRSLTDSLEVIEGGGYFWIHLGIWWFMFGHPGLT